MPIEKDISLVQPWLKWQMIGVEKLTMRAVLLDFSAAFDIINHNLLLQKLKRYGLLQNTLVGELFNKQ